MHYVEHDSGRSPKPKTATGNFTVRLFDQHLPPSGSHLPFVHSLCQSGHRTKLGKRRVGHNSPPQPHSVVRGLHSGAHHHHVRLHTLVVAQSAPACHLPVSDGWTLNTTIYAWSQTFRSSCDYSTLASLLHHVHNNAHPLYIASRQVETRRNRKTLAVWRRICSLSKTASRPNTRSDLCPHCVQTRCSRIHQPHAAFAYTFSLGVDKISANWLWVSSACRMTMEPTNDRPSLSSAHSHIRNRAELHFADESLPSSMPPYTVHSALLVFCPSSRRLQSECYVWSVFG